MIWVCFMGSPNCEKQSCPARQCLLTVWTGYWPPASQCSAMVRSFFMGQIRRPTSYQYCGEQYLPLLHLLCCLLVDVRWRSFCDSAANKTTVSTFLGSQYSIWEHFATHCSGLSVILWSAIVAVTPAWAVDMRNVFSKLSFCRTESRSTNDYFCTNMQHFFSIEVFCTKLLYFLHHCFFKHLFQTWNIPI